jgi:DNA-binding transcriptional regulator YdaS (Cro superfamily)
MTLYEYLTKHRKTMLQIADDVGVHYTHISRIVGGKRVPSSAVALKIEQATDGQVTIRELLYPDTKTDASTSAC